MVLNLLENVGEVKNRSCGRATHRKALEHHAHGAALGYLTGNKVGPAQLEDKVETEDTETSSVYSSAE
jgi:hypothetical protein